MKQTAKRILAFVSVVCIAVIGVFTMPFVSVNAEGQTAQLVTDASTLAEGDQVIIAAKDYDYALSTTQNKNNRGQASIKKDGNTATLAEGVQVLTLEAGTESGTFAFNTGDGYLYAASSSSNYLKTETTLSANSSWSITIADGVATVVAQGTYTRNVLQYNQSSSLFACYSSASQKAVCLYKLAEESEEVTAIREELNSVQAYMSMGYKYTKTSDWEDAPAVEDVEDTLNRAFTGVSGTSYSSWSDKKSNSSAVYAGQSAGGNDSIQLRSSNSNSGIVTTTSGGKAKKITIEWYENTAADRTVNVYGSNTAFKDATELYGGKDPIGTIGRNETEYVIDGDYEYIGIRSNSGALYLKEIVITWETESNATDGEVEVVTLSDSEFRIKCGVDASLDLSDINGVEYGIYVSAANGKDKYYASNSEFLQTDEEAEKKYIIISLGDIVNDVTKLTTEFTVCAYAKYNDKIYTSSTKTYSVAGMIEAYYDQGVEEVEVLYDYFNKNGAI